MTLCRNLNNKINKTSIWNIAFGGNKNIYDLLKLAERALLIKIIIKILIKIIIMFIG